jgi:Flp pilus assembly pilin Flp
MIREVALPHTFAAQLGQIIFLSVIALSAWTGRRTERIAAAALFVQLVTSSLLNHRHAFDPEYGVLAADAAVLIVYAVLAFGTNRRWTLWATAFQALAVLTHIARMIDPTLDRWAYLTTTILWGYAVLAALLVGTLQTAVQRYCATPPKADRV